MKDFDVFEKKVGVNFKNKDLLTQAFVHRSYLNENPEFYLDHNERLEFLGDAVLELSVTEYLYRNYKNSEGELTSWRAALVNADSLANIAKKLNFFEPKSQESAEAQKPSSDSSSEPNVLPSAPPAPTPAPNPATEPPAQEPARVIPKSILLEVPFFSQAPFGEWSDPIFQNACEEASIIMAMHWVNKTGVTKEQAKQEIQALTEFEDKTYGPATDRAAADATKMFKDYYNYSNVRESEGITTKDIKAQVLSGHLVIVPVNGQI